MSQHGVVISELRTSPGPTHSVSDVLAALIRVLRPEGRIGVLGFAGGGMQAPLSALGVLAKVHTVDLDRAGYELFCKHCPGWIGRVEWEHADAVDWLHGQAEKFDLLVEDLSVPIGDDIFKPDVTWKTLPRLMRDRLRTGGVAIFNLLPPPSGVWIEDLKRMAGIFRTARILNFDDFENRILIAGAELPAARAIGAELREALRSIRSRQAGRIHMRKLEG